MNSRGVEAGVQAAEEFMEREEVERAEREEGPP